MNPNAVRPVAMPGRQTDNSQAEMGTEPHGRCIQPYVLSAAGKPKYRSSHAVTGRCIVEIATIKSHQADTNRHISDIILKEKPGHVLDRASLCDFFRMVHTDFQ